MGIINWLLDLFENRTFGAARSSDWSALSRNFIKANPFCAMGMHKPTILNPLNTHHIESFHEHPEKEKDPNNWIVLCRFHHFIHAHLGNWASINLKIKEEAEALTLKIQNRP